MGLNWEFNRNNLGRRQKFCRREITGNDVGMRPRIKISSNKKLIIKNYKNKKSGFEKIGKNYKKLIVKT